MLKSFLWNLSQINQVFRNLRYEFTRSVKDSLPKYWGDTEPNVQDESVLKVHAAKIANIVVHKQAATTSDIAEVEDILRDLYLRVSRFDTD